MTTDEAYKYFFPAVRNLLDPKYIQNKQENVHHMYVWCFEIDRLLGIREWSNYNVGHNPPMAEELKELLTQLAGPHGEVLLKVHRARKGLEP